MASARDTPGRATLWLTVEKLRLTGYASFWVVVVTGIVATRMFGDVDLEDTLLVEVFGYNNICVYFDYPPSNYILPFLWAVTLTLLLAYLAAQWLQMRAELERDRLGPGLYRLLTGMHVFEATTLVAFSTIFAVSPEGWDHTLYIHTAPFFLLQFGMVSLAFSNTLYGIKSGYWRRMGLPSWFEKAALAYCAVFTLVVLFKVPYGVNAMADQAWWSHTDGLTRIAAFVDGLFLVCAAIIPMAKAGYLVVFESEELDVVRLAPSVVAGAD